MANVEQKAQQKPNSTERNKSATNLPFNSLDVNRLSQRNHLWERLKTQVRVDRGSLVDQHQDENNMF